MFEMVLNWLNQSWRLWLDLAPYLIVGFILAGLLHGLLGEKTIRKHFASSRFSSVLKATLLGIPLPICSCGVIPLAESLQKDGASKPATLAFLVSTPTSGVDSILATYGMMGPFFAIMRPLAGLLAGLGVGVLAGLGESGTKEVSQEKNPSPAVGRRGKSRLSIWREVFDYGLGQLPRDTGKWLILGTLAGGLVTALIPEGFVESHLGNPFLQYLSILLLSVPLYVCATGSIPLAVGLMVSGVLPGAALVLLIAGPATNTVTLTFIFKRMGSRTGFIYLISVIVVAILMGLVTDIFFSASLPQFIEAHAHVHSEGVSLWLLASAMALLGLIIWRMVPWGRLLGRKQSLSVNADALNELKVPDMTCMVCEKKIRNTLSQIPGLEMVKVELDKKTVSFEDGSLGPRVAQELKKMGYHPLGK